MTISVIVCGGRDYADGGFVFLALDYLHAVRGIGLLIEGGQRGADRFARQWAKARRVPCITEDADWDRLGHAAGPIRNARMLAMHDPDGVVAFPGRRGTADMVKQAKKAKKRVWYPALSQALMATRTGLAD